MVPSVRFFIMKLAFCLFKYFPFGGLQRDFMRIAHEAHRRGHSIQAFVMEWQGDEDPSIPVTVIPTKGVQNHTRKQNYVRRLHSLIEKGEYDLIVGFNKMPMLDVYYAADTCYKSKARNQHSILYRMTPRYHFSIAYEKAVFAPDSRAEILVLSAQQQKEFMDYYETSKNRFHLIPPGISRDRIAPQNAMEIRAELRKEFDLQGDDLLLLMVGSGFKTKGLDRIINGLSDLAFDLKQRTKLIVIGQDKAKLFQKMARQRGINDNIVFLGGREDVPRFLLGADLLVHPAYNENTGTVLLEALAAGLPVLTTDVCGYAHYVESAKAGIVLPSPFKQNQYDEALHMMLSSKEARSNWKENALNFIATADIYSLPERAVDVIEQIGQKRVSSA